MTVEHWTDEVRDRIKLVREHLSLDGTDAQVIDDRALEFRSGASRDLCDMLDAALSQIKNLHEVNLVLTKSNDRLQRLRALLAEYAYEGTHTDHMETCCLISVEQATKSILEMDDGNREAT